MTRRILIVFGSRFGATRNSAEVIADLLREVLDADVIVRRPRALSRSERRLEGVDAVVVGSSIVMGRWVPGVRRFLERTDFEGKRLAIFVSAAGVLNDRTEELSIEGRRALAVSRFVDPVLAAVEAKPVTVAALGGWWRLFGHDVFNNWDEAMVQGWAHEVAREFGSS